MKKILFLIMLALLQTVCCQAQIDKIVGEWTTVDDNTGEKEAVVRIYKAIDGLYYGKIVKLLVDDHQDEKCTECTGDDKNKPMLGLVIVRGMQEKDGELVGGKVLDPKSGKFYYAKITYENGRLKLRGSLDKKGLLGRSQYWKK